MSAEVPRSFGGSSGGGGAADSYIGSLISLTSKSEIRYEGVLFNINTDEASIGLRNVRSFGTEGRRKDGQQVLAIDKVYEYIVFRGSDIKDLQVKSSPPVQSAPSVPNDPAIIQSYAPTAPSSLSAAPAPVPMTAPTGSLPDFGAQLPQSGIPRPMYQNSVPLYQTGGNLAWNPSPPPTTNSSGLSVPMYWQGYYGPSASVQAQQQPLLRPGQSLPMQPSLQPPLAQQSAQFPTMNSSLPNGPSNISASQSIEFPPPLLQPFVSSNVSMSSTVLPVQSSSAPVQAVPVVSQGNSPLVSSTISNMLDKNTVPSFIPNQPKVISVSSMSLNSFSEPHSSVGTSGLPALVTPGQFLHPGHPVSQTSQMAQKDVEVVRSSVGSPPQPPVAVTAVSAAPVPVSTDTQAPLLPLPTPSNSKMNGVSSNSRYVNHRGGRGRGRGHEFTRPLANFTEEFDFEAMNSQFKKDEVWGHLGKIKENADDGLDIQDDDIDVPVVDKKPVYKKDDFFDTLSCNALDLESRNGRTRFSEQMRLDTETFGDFSRNRGFRGGRGRGPGRGGRGRGGYPGRGSYSYGYGGRGQGPNMYPAI